MPISPLSLSPGEQIRWMVDDTEGKLAPNRTYSFPTEGWSAQDWAEVNTTIDELCPINMENSVTYDNHPRFGGVHVFAVSCLGNVITKRPSTLELISTVDDDDTEVINRRPVAA